MEKLKDLKRIMYENYNQEELIEFYQRTIILLTQIGASEQIISNYLYQLEQLTQEDTKERIK